MNGSRERIRDNARKQLGKLLGGAPAWNRSHPQAALIPAASLALEVFLQRLEGAMHSAYPADDRYQGHLRELLGHLLKRPATAESSCFLFEVHLSRPEEVATMEPALMMSRRDLTSLSADIKTMDEFHHIGREHDKLQGVACPECGKVDINRLNLNLNALDDAYFGKGYEVTMEEAEMCTCAKTRALKEIEALRRERREGGGGSGTENTNAKEDGPNKEKAPRQTSGHFLTPDAIAAPSSSSDRTAAATAPQTSNTATAATAATTTTSSSEGPSAGAVIASLPVNVEAAVRVKEEVLAGVKRPRASH